MIMQKLIETQFFCYPKNKNLSVLYTDKKLLKSRLFKALSLQISPKEGALLRLRKTNFGHQLSTFNKKDNITLTIPDNRNLKIGYKNNGKIIFFELDKNNIPTKIVKINSDKEFEESSFLGYSIIENYTKKEYFSKRDFIKKALEKRWQEILDNKNLHGDFTHFNVLLSQEKKLYFIDNKNIENSVLFDHFYFYSYYMQCLERCKTLSSSNVSEIKADLQNIIFKTCKLDNLKEYLKKINIDDAVGLNVLERENRLKEFSNFLLRNEK